jgi:glucose/arabinose dehydrogenase
MKHPRAEGRPQGWLPAAAFATVLGGADAAAGTPPPGFVETRVVSGAATTGASAPTAVAYEPGAGHLWVLEKGSGSAVGQARVRRRDADTGVVTTALTLPCVDGQGERGLLGIAFSPDFLEPGGASRHVYLYYTRAVTDSGACALSGQPSGARNRVSRFIESAGTLSGEQVVLDGPYLTSATNHNGGTLRFAPDRTLFISMGDNNTDSNRNPLSRDLGDLRGKLLRIRGDGSIPEDNPFVGQAGVRPEIWAWGLRNPFRFSLDPETGTPVIANVGEATWEAVYVGVPGADHGYPCLEGRAPFRSCNPAPPAGTVTLPVFVYGHANQTPPVFGNSITGGPVYRGGAFPEEYEGAYFFGDFGAGWIRRGRITSDGRLVDVEMFMPDATRVVDIVVSPEGCLTWVSIGGDGVREVCHVPGPNGPPRARSTADPVSGAAPLEVRLTGSSSSDPDGDALDFLWDTGDGQLLTEADPVHTYDADGVFDVLLTVDDRQQQANSTDGAPPLRIVVGNAAPSAAIDAPAPGTTYDAGSTISFAGSAGDPEDDALPPGAFSWTIAFHHGGHEHPVLGPVTGISAGQFTVPTSGEDDTDVFFRIHLTVTDSGAPLGASAQLASTASVDLAPRVATIVVATEPAGAGLALTLDGALAVAPFSRDSVVGFSRTLGAPSPQVIGGRTFEFVSWSNGGSREHVVSTPATSTTYTARFACVASCGPDSDGDGFTSVQGDCNDGDRGVFPGAPEICDSKDNDCDGSQDNVLCTDFDATGDGRVDGVELSWLGRAFALCSIDPALEWWSAIDLRPDGCVDGDDLAVLANVWACNAGLPVCEPMEPVP